MSEAVPQVKVAAVIVTFNRQALLKECLAGLFAQARKPDAIFLIDNASSDGTDQFLASQTWPADIDVRVTRLPKNTGGAGGFYEGVKRAHEAGYDWLWMMDDDVQAEPEALARLLTYTDRSGCIQCTRIGLDGKPIMWGGYYDAARIKAVHQYALYAEGETRSSVAVSLGCFEGMFVSRQVVDQIGYPDPRLFMVEDDTLYGYLASRVTTVLLVRDACLRKMLSSYTGWKDDSYVMRVSPLFCFLTARNRVAIARQIRSDVSWPLFAREYLGVMAWAYREGGWSLLKVALRGAWHGLLGRWGGETEYLVKK